MLQVNVRLARDVFHDVRDVLSASGTQEKSLVRVCATKPGSESEH